MHSLPFNQQIKIICHRANTRRINHQDRYLEVYSELLQGVQALLPLNRQNIILASHAVFGWMPTQLRVNILQLNRLLPNLNGVLSARTNITVNDLDMMASTFQTANGNSVVAASKILHFLAPDRFPIWDKSVAKTWGLPPSGPRAAANYHRFIQACLAFAAKPLGHQACVTLRHRLARSGYAYPITDMRAIELIFFLPP